MKVEELTRQDKAAAVSVLCASFYDYPVMRYVLRDSGKDYDHHLQELIGFFCESRLSRNSPLLGVRDAGQVVAAALISMPLPKPRPPELQKTIDRLMSVIGAEALARFEHYDKQSGQFKPPAPHYYLGMIGVHPEHQGRGYAKSIIEAVKAMSANDTDSSAVCLNTETEGNVPLYEHLGFRVIGKTEVADFTSWCMLC